MAGPWERFQPTAKEPGPWNREWAGRYAKPGATPQQPFGLLQAPRSPGGPGSEVAESAIPEALGMTGSLLATLLAPQTKAVGLLARGANLGSRMAFSGGGNAAGRSAGELLTGNTQAPTLGQIGQDVATGAAGELVGSTIAWPVAQVAKGTGKIAEWYIRRRMGLTAGAVAGDLSQAAAGQARGLGGEHYERLSSLMGGPDAVVPAPETMAVLRGLQDANSGGWSDVGVELFGTNKGQRVRLMNAYSGGKPYEQTAWTVRPRMPFSQIPTDPTVTTFSKPGPGWVGHYLVFDDGGALLFWENPRMGAFREGTKASSKAKETLSLKELVPYLQSQRPNRTAVAVDLADPIAGGRYLPRVHGFDVTRHDGLSWQRMNDLMSNFNSSEKFGGLSKEAKTAFYAVRDALRRDVSNFSPAAENTLGKALRAYRWSNDLSGSLGNAVRAPARGLGKAATVFTGNALTDYDTVPLKGEIEAQRRKGAR